MMLHEISGIKISKNRFALFGYLIKSSFTIGILYHFDAVNVLKRESILLFEQSENYTSLRQLADRRIKVIFLILSEGRVDYYF